MTSIALWHSSQSCELWYVRLLSLLFFKEQLLQESELLTFWGKPPYQPFSKQQEEESRLYKIPSLKTGLKMCSVLIFHYTDSFSCCNILARLFPSTNCYHSVNGIVWSWVFKQKVDIYRNSTQVLFLYSFLNAQVIQWWTFKNSDLFFRFQLWPLHCELMMLVKKWRERLHKIFI